jgi:hypothetical protein
MNSQNLQYNVRYRFKTGMIDCIVMYQGMRYGYTYDDIMFGDDEFEMLFYEFQFIKTLTNCVPDKMFMRLLEYDISNNLFYEFEIVDTLTSLYAI